MSRIQPIKRGDAPEFENLFRLLEQTTGFVPNSLLTMAHRPDILRGFAQLAAAVLRGGTVSPGLKQLVALVASTAHGCRYCQAHTADSAHSAGVTEEQIQAAYEFETSPLFDDAQVAALRLARDAAVVPNAVTAEHFDSLRQHFTDGQVLELVSVISLFGWLNRWNDTLATELEAKPLAFAQASLRQASWDPGKHSRQVQR